MYTRYQIPMKIIFLFLIGTSFIFICYWTVDHIRINYTDSMLKGIYYATDEEPTNGDIVVVCLPDKIAKFGLLRGYLKYGTCSNGAIPIVKRVIASNGDLVEMDERGLRVNGIEIKESNSLDRDSQNRDLTSVKGKAHLLGENEVWLFGENSKNSWDSRYYGPININDVTHVLLPILTW